MQAKQTQTIRIMVTINLVTTLSTSILQSKQVQHKHLFMQKQTDPIVILEKELQHRIKRNPQYSLRAFAKSLGLSHTFLSLLLTKKRKLSKRAAEKIAQNLTLPEKEISNFLRYYNQSAENTNYHLKLEDFHLIADWAFYAILSLVRIPSVILEPKWVSKVISISEIKAKLIISTLNKAGFIKKVGNHWQRTAKPIIFENSKSTHITRRFHRELLHKAIESLDNDPFELRDHSSITFAVDPKHIPYARECIREFRRNLVKKLEAKGNPQEVYNLTVQIFPTSKINNYKREDGE